MQHATHTALPLPPGPRGYPIVGVLPRLWPNPLDLLLELRHTYGDVVHLGAHWFLLAHPDHLALVLNENAAAYHKGGPVKQLHPILGMGLPLNDGPAWRRQRRLVQPAFNRQQIQSYIPMIAQNTLTMLEDWRYRDQPVDIEDAMMQLTLHIIVTMLFGSGLATDDIRAIGAAFTTVHELASYRSRTLIAPPLALPTSQHRQFREAIQFLNGIVQQSIATYRHNPDETTSMLSVLLHTRDAETGETMSDQQLRDEVMTLLMAGHETTANALTWVWYLLAQHPTIEAQLAAEAMQVLQGHAPEVADLPRLSYTRQVIEETLRLYPPGWTVMRTPLRDEVIGGYRIPARSTLLLSPYITHRHPAFWEQPEYFDPARFAPNRAATRPRYAYLPFGGGPRVCIGNHLALMEAQIIVACIAQACQLQLESTEPVPIQPLFTLRPARPILMHVQWRAEKTRAVGDFGKN